jgi:hypothetical protein
VTSTLLAFSALGYLTACSSGGSSSPKNGTPAPPVTTAPSTSAAGSASPSPSPSAAGGAGTTYAKTTADDDLCRVLTSDDLGKLGMIDTQAEASAFAPTNSPIGVTCTYALGDAVNAGVLPSVGAATALLTGLRATLTSPAPVAVPGASVAFFAPTREGEFALLSQRGTLILWVNMDPKVNQFTADKAKTAAIGITQLVLKRAPNLG